MPDLVKLLADIDEPEANLDDWQCPNCGWEADDNTYYDDPDMFLGSWDFKPTWDSVGQFTTATWMEKWKCPECGTVWEYENNNI